MLNSIMWLQRHPFLQRLFRFRQLDLVTIFHRFHRKCEHLPNRNQPSACPPPAFPPMLHNGHSIVKNASTDVTLLPRACILPQTSGTPSSGLVCAADICAANSRRQTSLESVSSRSRLQIPTVGVSWGATGTIPSMILEYMDASLRFAARDPLKAPRWAALISQEILLL